MSDEEPLYRIDDQSPAAVRQRRFLVQRDVKQRRAQREPLRDPAAEILNEDL